MCTLFTSLWLGETCILLYPLSRILLRTAPSQRKPFAEVGPCDLKRVQDRPVELKLNSEQKAAFRMLRWYLERQFQCRQPAHQRVQTCEMRQRSRAGWNYADCLLPYGSWHGYQQTGLFVDGATGRGLATCLLFYMNTG